MTRAKKAAAAMLNTWKFKKGDTVMIARGRNRGRVAQISEIIRDGNTAPRRGRQVPRHKKDRWKENPKVYLDGKANAGRQVLRGNRSIDADRPLPISNVCHVVQSTNAANKSSYKCVRVEFFEQEGDNKKVRVPKADPTTQLPAHWQKKSRLPKTRKHQSAKFVSADIAHERSYFPPTTHSRSALGRPHAAPHQRATFHTLPAPRFSSFASQIQHSRLSTLAYKFKDCLEDPRGTYKGALWDQLQELMEKPNSAVQKCLNR